MNAMMVREGHSFYEAESSTNTLKHSETSQIKYDLIDLQKNWTEQKKYVYMQSCRRALQFQHR